MEELKGIRTGLVCIETVNRVLAGGDENSPKDMGSLVDNLTFIQERAHVAIDLVHHIPADGTHRLRGHGSLLGACDVTQRVEKHGNKLHSLTIDDANDGPEGEKIVFKLVSVELHHDAETGITTTAPVVVPHDGEAGAEHDQKITPKQKLAMEALLSLIAERGQKPPPSLDLPAGLLVVPINAWRDELHRRDVLDKDAANPRSDFRKLKEQLKGKHLIAEIDLLVWAVRAAV
jgi:hypothetical protein